jgi:class 3 adenylate cyclase
MLAAVVRLRDGVLRIGARPSDRPEVRVRKESLVLTAVAITVLATLWVATYLLLGRPLSAMVPFAYQVITIASLAYFARTGNLAALRATQVSVMLVLPFVLQWTLGGFANSSAVMVWAFAAPVGALVLYPPRRAVVFFAGYLALALVSGVIDPLLAAHAEPMPTIVRESFFVLNIGAVSVVTFAVLVYFVADRERAQHATDDLLHNVLPDTIADRLKAGEQHIADDHDAVAVVFADVAGFTTLAREAGADNVLAILDSLFSAFDGLAERFGLEKIKTIGDAYMAVAGAPQPRPDHVRAAADMGLAMLDAAQHVSAEVGHDLPVRVGIHAGPAIAGVIGRRKFVYDLWGDAVNVASRMESHGVPGRIQVSDTVAAALSGEYRFEDRGTIDIKGLGSMHTYFLLGPA